VIGVQAGVPSTVRLCLKFFNNNLHYVEIMIDKATCLPKMDSGLGTCDAYCKIVVGDYQFKTRVVRNSLDPEFKQSFRIAISVR
jgi:Ca2+-dependent lipid-binding protein